ncbi:MAG: bacterioferritin [Acidobacteria bacterium]|nr:bacterioferritin [Acidobacteriota bacterium]
MSDKTSKKQFLSSVSELRTRARKKIEAGALTEAYPLNPEEACGILNEALATELVCVLRYRFHYFMASGIHSGAVAKEFLVHSNEEQGHADLLAERIKQLGGKPEMNPDILTQMSHSEYKEGDTLAEMLKEDLVAERIAIDSYRELIEYFGHKDPTTRRLLESILAVEEEHADELADFLFAQEEGSDTPRKLYAKDEVVAKAAVPKSGKMKNVVADKM